MGISSWAKEIEIAPVFCIGLSYIKPVNTNIVFKKNSVQIPDFQCKQVQQQKHCWDYLGKLFHSFFVIGPSLVLSHPMLV